MLATQSITESAGDESTNECNVTPKPTRRSSNSVFSEDRDVTHLNQGSKDTQRLNDANARDVDHLPTPANGSPDSIEKLAEEEGHSVKDGSVFSIYDRFGWLAITILVVTTLLILGTVGFLWFLWMSSHSNTTWHAIAERNWITRAVTLSSVLLRTSVSMQATTGTSMLAGLALEKAQILILHLASVSMMRNANAGPYMLLWLIFKAFLKNPRRWRQSLVPTLILLLAIVSLLTEFTSTTLLSDFKQGTIPGHSSSSTIATNFVYDVNETIPFLSRGTVWTKKPPLYPAFAEYHKDLADVPADTSDTGMTLRAFIPLQAQEQRSMLRNFSGRATVFDSRVRCVRPRLSMEKGHYAPGALGLSGEITAFADQSRNFSCVLPLLNGRADGATPALWQLGMTYLSYFSNASVAPLQSELRQKSSNGSYGMAFLVANVTAGSLVEWRSILGTDADEFGKFGGTGVQPRSYRGRNDWADLIFTANESLIMSASLCYAAYDTAILDINASSGANRTEPSATYDAQSQSYDYSSVRKQLGQGPAGQYLTSPEDRGVLSISERKSWLPGEDDYAQSIWLLDALELKLDGDPSYSFDYLGASSTSNGTIAYMYESADQNHPWRGFARFSPDPSITAVFQQILQNQGSIAFALQSILTIFTGMTYYDQLEQFNSPNKVQTTPFMLVSRPHSVRGIVAVTAVLAVHLTLMGVMLYLFLASSVVSTIGNAWQTLSQIMRGDALELAKVAALATDNRVEDKVKDERWKHRLVGLKLCDNSGNVKLVYRDSPGGLAKMMKNASRRRRRFMARRHERRADQRCLESDRDTLSTEEEMRRLEPHQDHF